MNQELVDKANELGIALTRHDHHTLELKGRNKLTVKDLREFIEGLEDSLELEVDYYSEDYSLDYFEVYHTVIKVKTDNELQAEIDNRLKQLEKNKEDAAKNKELDKARDLIKIKSLEAELKKLKKKHKV